jgi:hypothetical protein
MLPNLFFLSEKYARNLSVFMPGLIIGKRPAKEQKPRFHGSGDGVFIVFLMEIKGLFE